MNTKTDDQTTNDVAEAQAPSGSGLGGLTGSRSISWDSSQTEIDEFCEHIIGREATIGNQRGKIIAAHGKDGVVDGRHTDFPTVSITIIPFSNVKEHLHRHE